MLKCEICNRSFEAWNGDSVPDHSIDSVGGVEIECSGPNYWGLKHDLHASGHCPITYGHEEPRLDM